MCQLKPAYKQHTWYIYHKLGVIILEYSMPKYGEIGKHALKKRSPPFSKEKLPFDALSNVYQTDVWSVRYT